MADGHDGSNHLRNTGQVITIEDARGLEDLIEFKAFITAFEDKFDSNWNETEVYARMDPIYTFQNTKRTISISFTAPSFDTKEAEENMKKSMTMSRLMYPSYDINEGVSTLSAAPIFKVQFANLIMDPNTGGPMFGVIKAYSFKPKLEDGWHTQGNTIVPKALEISFDFNVLHSHPLGYNSTEQKFRTGEPKDYPYGSFGLESQSISPPSSRPLSVTSDRTTGPGAIRDAQNTNVLT